MEHAEELIEVIEKSTGMPYWYTTSDFCGGCWHIYSSNYKDSHLYNLFSEAEFKAKFSEVERR